MRIEKTRFRVFKTCAGCGKEIEPQTPVEVVNGKLIFHNDGARFHCLTPKVKAEILRREVFA